uniref:Helix-turn-helix domain-containing protein n=1 Tax=Trichobilharzia regenti TaxID=157069 RepID=A0AA85JZC3_TRIRE|nr:unnamed protein product [Trichobilharzia regenti]
MRSPISGLIAEAIMHRLELIALPIIKPKVCVRYIDDTFVIIKRNDLEYTHKLINKNFEDIRFTKESDMKIPFFLDVLIRGTNTENLETQVYRKTTHTDQIINYSSNNPITHNRNCVQTLFKRVQTHCSTPVLKRMEETHLLTSCLQKEWIFTQFHQKVFKIESQHQQETIIKDNKEIHSTM